MHNSAATTAWSLLGPKPWYDEPAGLWSAPPHPCLGTTMGLGTLGTSVCPNSRRFSPLSSAPPMPQRTKALKQRASTWPAPLGTGTHCCAHAGQRAGHILGTALLLSPARSQKRSLGHLPSLRPGLCWPDGSMALCSLNQAEPNPGGPGPRSGGVGGGARLRANPAADSSVQERQGCRPRGHQTHRGNSHRVWGEVSQCK